MIKVISFLSVCVVVSASLLFSMHRFVQHELNVEARPGVEVRFRQSDERRSPVSGALQSVRQISWSADAGAALLVKPYQESDATWRYKEQFRYQLVLWRKGERPISIGGFREVDEIALSPDASLALVLARESGDAIGSSLYFWTPGEGLQLVRDKPFEHAYRIEFVGTRPEALLLSSKKSSESFHLSFTRRAGSNRVRQTPPSLAFSFSLQPLHASPLMASLYSSKEIPPYPRADSGNAILDLNNDGAADILTFRAAAGRALWKGYTLDGVSSTLPGVTTVLGSSAVWSLGDERGVPVPGDYNGDGLLDFATYTPEFRETDSDLRGNWQVYLSRSARMNSSRVLPPKTSGFFSVRWGHTNYRAVPADYDGDGATDIAVFDPGSAQWHILFSAAGFNPTLAHFKPDASASETLQWGLPDDTPFALDMNGDSCADHVVLRRGTKLSWQVKYRMCRGQAPATSTERIEFGKEGDLPVPADFNGDGVVELGLYRRSQRRWLIRDSDGSVKVVRWSSQGRPFSQDFDADGRDDLAFFNARGDVHYEILSSRVSSDLRRDLIHRGLGIQKVAWGSEQDIPTVILSLDHRMGVSNE